MVVGLVGLIWLKLGTRELGRLCTGRCAERLAEVIMTIGCRERRTSDGWSGDGRHRDCLLQLKSCFEAFLGTFARVDRTAPDGAAILFHVLTLPVRFGGRRTAGLTSVFR